jgi:hypothetical protein
MQRLVKAMSKALRYDGLGDVWKNTHGECRQFSALGNSIVSNTSRLDCFSERNRGTCVALPFA